MQRPLLSLCIPTYNRSFYLEKSLASIVKQKEFLEGKVEIVVSDNASTDETQATVLSFCEKYENVHYYRNEENVRDRNFPLVLGRGTGVLRKLCNDTLIFLPGSLQYMCELIEQNKETRPFMIWAGGSGLQDEDLLETDFACCIKQVSFFVTSIAIYSFWDQDCEDIENDMNGTELSLWQMRKGLQIASEKNRVTISNRQLYKVENVEKKDVSYGLFQVFYQNYFTLLQPYFENGTLDLEIREFLEKDLLFRFFMLWIIKWEVKRTGEQYSAEEDLSSIIFRQYGSKPYWAEYVRKYKVEKRKFIIKNMIKARLKQWLKIR